MKQVKVLVVDDSAFMRKAIAMILESDPEISVIGKATNGIEGLEMVKALKPDVVTLDIEMPQMDGLTALKHIMTENPTPVMMLSSLTTEGASATLDALSLGAVDFIPKQLSFVALDIVKIKDELLRKVKHIARNKPAFYLGILKQSKSGELRSARSAKQNGLTMPGRSGKSRPGIIAIGSSTGGPPALQAIIPKLPANLPVPVTVVQHMPPTFTKSLAERLDTLSAVHVKEAEHGESLLSSGQVLLADEPATTLHRPAVDVMVKSVAEEYGSRVLGVILTGMGSDGLEGLRLVKAKGGKVFAQDEASCVVYGMPRVVIEEKLADKVVHIDNLAKEIVECF